METVVAPAAAKPADPPHARMLEVLRGAHEAVIATAAGADIRLRLMHVGFEDDFTVYLASMHGDPKVAQMTHNPSVAILIHRVPDDVTQAEEVEYTGRAQVVRDSEQRRRCLAATARTSPIVSALVEQGNAGVLDCIRIVPLLVKYRRFRDIVRGVPPTVLEFPQHREAVSDWWRLGARLRAWWIALRPNSLVASIVPMVVGAAIAFWHYRSWLPGAFVLSLLAAVLLQAGTNLLNDYNDHRSGNDARNRGFIRPFGGGSRVIQSGLLAPAEVLAGTVVLLAGAMGIGTALAVNGRPAVAVLAAAGAAIGILYNRQGWNLVRAGLGEAAAALAFGPLLVVGADYVQSGRLDPLAALGAVPLGVLIGAVLLINEFQDDAADRATAKNTLVVRVGRSRSADAVGAALAAAYAGLLVLAALGVAPAGALIATASAPLGYLAWQTCRRHHDSAVDLAPANARLALTHASFGMLQAAGCLLVAGPLAAASLGILGVGFALMMHRYTERLRLAAAASSRAVQA